MKLFSLLKIFFLSLFIILKLIYCLQKIRNDISFSKEKGFKNENDRFFLNQCIKENLECIIVCNQDKNGIYIYDLQSKKLLWNFIFEKSKDILTKHKNRFKAISDAKLIYDGKYVLSSSSEGGIALIELRTKKVLNYLIEEGNIHSIEMIPDGSLITIASDENFFSIHTGFIEKLSNYTKKFYLPFGHALLWDDKRQLLWVGGNRTIRSYKYIFDFIKPNLEIQDNLYINDDEVHELIPIYDCPDHIWVVTLNYIYIFNLKTKITFEIHKVKDGKSISSLRNKNNQFNKLKCLFLKKNFSQKLNEELSLVSKKVLKDYFNTIYVYSVKEWWSDKIYFLFNNETALNIKKAKIYKARWFTLNPFSYNLTNYSKSFY